MPTLEKSVITLPPAKLEYHPTIHDIPVDERPRERLKHYGPQALSNSELLAILLRTGTTRDNVIKRLRVDPLLQQWGFSSFLYGFNSQSYSDATIYIGIWGRSSGTLWIDDVQFEGVNERVPVTGPTTAPPASISW